MYPWLRMGPLAISTYSLLFLCAFIVGSIITYYEERQVEQEFIERRGLAAHPILGDSPGQIAGQAERITTEQVAEPPDSLG